MSLRARQSVAIQYFNLMITIIYLDCFVGKHCLLAMTCIFTVNCIHLPNFNKKVQTKISVCTLKCCFTWREYEFGHAVKLAAGMYFLR